MKVDRYLHLVPTIEEQIRALKPDAVVFGMGPTGWLLPWVDQRLLRDVRLWTCHDGCRIQPADDLVIMDPPHRALHPDTTRHQEIVRSRPKRIWIINTAYNHACKRTGKVLPLWAEHLNDAVKPIVTVQKYRVWHPHTHPKALKPELGNDPPDTIATSVAGAVTLAWNQGARRIGVIGCDLMKQHHHLYELRGAIDSFFAQLAQQAHAQGGAITNLSPVTSLERFKSWSPSASSSAPIVGSETAAPNSSSNTVFVAAPHATFPLPGCEAATQGGKSASSAATAPGG